MNTHYILCGLLCFGSSLAAHIPKETSQLIAWGNELVSAHRELQDNGVRTVTCTDDLLDALLQAEAAGVSLALDIFYSRAHTRLLHFLQDDLEQSVINTKERKQLVDVCQFLFSAKMAGRYIWRYRLTALLIRLYDLKGRDRIPADKRDNLLCRVSTAISTYHTEVRAIPQDERVELDRTVDLFTAIFPKYLRSLPVVAPSSHKMRNTFYLATLGAGAKLYPHVETAARNAGWSLNEFGKTCVHLNNLLYAEQPENVRGALSDAIVQAHNLLFDNGDDVTEAIGNLRTVSKQLEKMFHSGEEAEGGVIVQLLAKMLKVAARAQAMLAEDGDISQSSKRLNSLLAEDGDISIAAQDIKEIAKSLRTMLIPKSNDETTGQLIKVLQAIERAADRVGKGITGGIFSGWGGDKSEETAVVEKGNNFDDDDDDNDNDGNSSVYSDSYYDDPRL